MEHRRDVKHKWLQYFVFNSQSIKYFINFIYVSPSCVEPVRGQCGPDAEWFAIGIGTTLTYTRNCVEWSALIQWLSRQSDAKYKLSITNHPHTLFIPLLTRSELTRQPQSSIKSMAFVVVYLLFLFGVVVRRQTEDGTLTVKVMNWTINTTTKVPSPVDDVGRAVKW